jgi:phosphatase NudJ
VQLNGVLRVEHSPTADSGARCRVFFIATPADDTAPRTTPNEESLGAAWVALRELGRYPLRGDEVRDVLRYVDEGGAVYPLSILTFEGARWRTPRE